MQDSLKKKTLVGLLWSYLERTGTQIVSFLVTILLARILMPDDYGVIAIVIVFINICDVFVQSGMGMSLVQSKDVDEYDFSSVFWISLGVSVSLFFLLFFLSPYIAIFYDMPILAPVLQVLGLRLPVSSYNTVQRAIVSRQMQFKTYFYSSLIGIFISAAVGIVMAITGFGVWALVGQQLTNALVSTVVVASFVRWYPKMIFSWVKVKRLYKFGLNILLASLIDVLYEDFRSLYVGKLYSAADLAFYTRGKQFPHLISSNVNSSISTVLFPALSRKQDDILSLRNMTRRAIKTSSFVMMPLMFGLAAIAKPFVLLVLTGKWLPCVPFVQILCINYAIMPIQTANIQAIYAIGRSDLVMKMNLLKKSLGFVIILVFATYSVIAMAWGGVLYGIIASIINALPNKKFLGYSYADQLKDIAPYAAMSSLMSLFVIMLEYMLDSNTVMLLSLQIILGIVVYLLLAYLFKHDDMLYVINNMKVLK